jgi:hypothetical protein
VCRAGDSGSREHDRSSDLERVAERPHVVAPALERAALDRHPIASSVVPVIQVDDLRHVPELLELGLELAVIEPGSAVQQQERRPLAHHGTVGYELRALDVEVEPDIAYLDTRVGPSRCPDL